MPTKDEVIEQLTGLRNVPESQRVGVPVYKALQRVGEAGPAYRETDVAVLGLRFGLGSEEPMTFGAISRKLGVSDTRIQQRFQRGIRALRHPEFWK